MKFPGRHNQEAIHTYPCQVIFIFTGNIYFHCEIHTLLRLLKRRRANNILKTFDTVYCLTNDIPNYFNIINVIAIVEQTDQHFGLPLVL